MLAENLTWKDKELRSKTGTYCGDLTVQAEVQPSPVNIVSFGFRWNNVNNWSKGFMRTGMKAKRKRVCFGIEKRNAYEMGVFDPLSGIGPFKQASPNFGPETSDLFR